MGGRSGVLGSIAMALGMSAVSGSLRTITTSLSAPIGCTPTVDVHPAVSQL